MNPPSVAEMLLVTESCSDLMQNTVQTQRTRATQRNEEHGAAPLRFGRNQRASPYLRRRLRENARMMRKL